MWKVFNYGKKKNATKISTTGLENGMKKEGRQLAHPLKFLFCKGRKPCQRGSAWRQNLAGRLSPYKV